MSNISANSPVNHKSAGRAAARNAVLINLFVVPGLGSLMGRRVLEGVGQIILSLAGFTLVIIWFVNLMGQYYGLINGQETAIESRALVGITGAITFVTAWLWGLGTGVRLVRKARRDDLAEVSRGYQRQDDAGSK